MLRGHPFEHMPVSIRQKLVAHLADGLRVVEGELQRRGLGSRTPWVHALADSRTRHPVVHNGNVLSVNVQAEGSYELFETIHKHRILVLDDRRYTWIEGHRGEVLVPTDDGSRKVHTLQRGHFMLVAVSDEPGGPVSRTGSALCGARHPEGVARGW